jgi:hypothetical protein
MPPTQWHKKTEPLNSLDASHSEVLLVDSTEYASPLQSGLAERLANWDEAVLYNDAVATETSLKQGNPDFGQSLVARIHSLAGTSMGADSIKRKVH